MPSPHSWCHSAAAIIQGSLEVKLLNEGVWGRRDIEEEEPVQGDARSGMKDKHQAVIPSKHVY